MPLRRVLTIGALLLMVSGCSSGSDDAASTSTTSPYTAAVRSTFMQSCAGGGGNFTTCECAYDEIVRTVPFDRFQEVDEFMRTNPDSDMPEDIRSIIVDCIETSP